MIPHLVDVLLSIDPHKGYVIARDAPTSLEEI